MTAPEPDGIVWRTSSYSGSGSACIEVAPAPDGVLVRDSKDPDGPTLAVPTAAWRGFLVNLPRVDHAGLPTRIPGALGAPASGAALEALEPLRQSGGVG